MPGSTWLTLEGHMPTPQIKDDLLKRAREIGIKGRSAMTKAQLVSALRQH